MTDPVAAWDRLSPAYLTPGELREVGFAALGSDVQISRDVRVYGAGRVSIGSHVRIDDFTIISASREPVSIGDHVHIHSYCGLYAGAGLVIEDFAGLSGRVSIYTQSDGYTGRALTNPTVPAEYTAVKSAAIRLGRHAIVGSGAVLLPGASVGTGGAVGALALVTRPVPEWTVVTGQPARFLKNRRRDLLELEQQLLVRERDAG